MTVLDLQARFQAIPGAAVTETVHSRTGVHLDITVPTDRVTDCARLMKEAQYALEAITGVDWLAEKQIEILYDYTLYASGARIVVRTRVPRDKPQVETICTLHPGANWHERETHDFFGVKFSGHPDLTPLLLPEDADFHPLRKDYGT